MGGGISAGKKHRALGPEFSGAVLSQTDWEVLTPVVTPPRQDYRNRQELEAKEGRHEPVAPRTRSADSEKEQHSWPHHEGLTNNVRPIKQAARMKRDDFSPRDLPSIDEYSKFDGQRPIPGALAVEGAQPGGDWPGGDFSSQDHTEDRHSALAHTAPDGGYSNPDYGYVPSLMSSGADQHSFSKSSQEYYSRGSRDRSSQNYVEHDSRGAGMCAEEALRARLWKGMGSEGGASHLSGGSRRSARQIDINLQSSDSEYYAARGLVTGSSAFESHLRHDDEHSSVSSSNFGTPVSNVRICLGPQSRPAVAVGSEIAGIPEGLSIGSTLHVDGTCTPCAFHFSNKGPLGSCHHGKMCEFCHEEEHRQQPRPRDHGDRRGGRGGRGSRRYDTRSLERRG
mmetsp:Transcript_429/g.1028  ORF Transcript_429/g.1028 Transcript_429/m.1028 type:complete len:395 (-) Transcript_429:190-1374(-)